MDAIEVLRKARDLWVAGSETNGNYAVNRNGEPCDATSPDACRWCAVGAMAKVQGFEDETDVFKTKACEALSDAVGGSVPWANDIGRLTREHWDTAIRNLGGEP